MKYLLSLSLYIFIINNYIFTTKRFTDVLDLIESKDIMYIKIFLYIVLVYVILSLCVIIFKCCNRFIDYLYKD